MEMEFENKGVSSYTESSHQIRRFQESMESVVPDINDDIGKIITVHSELFLKSKDLTGRGVFLTGEIKSTLLYITETGDRVAAVHLGKDFHIDYEVSDSENEQTAQIRLCVANTEARVLNPRKVSVTVELMGEITCFEPSQSDLSIRPPENSDGSLFLLEKEDCRMISNTVSEKSFSLNDQFVFPETQEQPKELLWESHDFSVSSCQSIGSRMIVKGEMTLEAWYLAENNPSPQKAEFHMPFSQILESGAETVESCTVQMIPSTSFFHLIDTIGGAKALDTEIHGVLQLVGRSREIFRYIEDAYHAKMPTSCRFEEVKLPLVTEMTTLPLNTRTEIPAAEDCSEILTVFAGINIPACSDGKLKTAVNLDILYRTPTGEYNAMRRQISLEGDVPAGELRTLKTSVKEVNLIRSGDAIQCELTAAVCIQCRTEHSVRAVTSIALAEEEAFDFTAIPSLYLVRTGSESLWELAKTYHSSVEAIKSLNPEDQDRSGQMLLIPRVI